MWDHGRSIGGLGDVTPSDEVEMEPMEVELEKDPSKGLGSTSSVHLD